MFKVQANVSHRLVGSAVGVMRLIYLKSQTRFFFIEKRSIRGEVTGNAEGEGQGRGRGGEGYTIIVKQYLRNARTLIREGRFCQKFTNSL